MCLLRPDSWKDRRVSVYTREVSRLGGLGRSHELVAALVPPGAAVLDVGCASGYLARELLARGASAVDGIEPDPDDAATARAVCRTVVAGSIEEEATLALVADAAYDAIVLADVVEHLRDPEAALRGLVPKLAPGGRFVLSVPNVAHWSVRASLLRGRFRYEDVGLLDRTHLRFFTRESLLELLDACGLQLEREEHTFRGRTDPEALGAIPLVGGPATRAYRPLARRLAGALAYQFVVSARPAPD
jgi:2-polyprenyl-3-methyl-5-hydroxy-6-metoxy-1,4-benzoquinol methylase